jgi:hypothetical protein
LSSKHHTKDHVSCPYKTTGKIVVMYIFIFTFLYRRREDKTKVSAVNDSNHRGVIKEKIKYYSITISIAGLLGE